MVINVTARHADISDAMKAHVHEKLNAVLNAYPQVEHAHVILDIQKFRHIIEVVVQAKRHQKIEATDESEDMYASIDRVADKLDRQLRRAREKVVDHKTAQHRVRLTDLESSLNEENK
ncbi:MAG: ribosome-associated translation inhibitor RaiA [Kiritimatiellae bacterium]|nr:ribosome-associated translation inhibitor RaiA [Kiritimatiellia bacterium]